MLGYVFAKLKCEPAPLMLGFVLGPMMEENLRRALLLARGEWTVFLSSPISAGLLLCAVLALAVMSSSAIRRKREDAFVEE